MIEWLRCRPAVARRAIWGMGVLVPGAVSFLLIGMTLVHSISVHCVSGTAPDLTCTVTSRYWLRTTEAVVDEVTGVTVSRRDTGSTEVDNGIDYQVLLSTVSGPAGPDLAPPSKMRDRAGRDADRIRELIGVSGGSATTHSFGPTSAAENVLWWFGLWLLLALVAFPATMFADMAFVRSLGPGGPRSR